MKKKTSITKRIFCLALSICMCLSLSLFAKAIEPLDGPINADDNAQLVTPTLEVSTSPNGAIAIAKNMSSGATYYYSVSGSIINSAAPSSHSTEGYIPQAAQTQQDAGALPNVVIPPDGRYSVNASQYPYRCIGVLVAFYSNGSSTYGTAYMISPNVAVTAGHCIYDKELLEFPSAMIFYPGASGNGNISDSYGYANAVEAAVSVEWYTSLDDNYDWGVVSFGNNYIGSNCGYLGISYIDRNPAGRTVTISGYPNEYQFNQYAHSGTIQSSSTTYIFNYDVDVTQGQSGAPILYYNSGSWFTLGVHTTEQFYAGTVYRNSGARYTSDLYDFLVAYK